MIVTQVAHHVIRLTLSTPPPSKRRTSQPYGVYGIRTRLLVISRQCVTHYSTNSPHAVIRSSFIIFRRRL